MSFWTDDEATGTYEAPSGFEPIPSNTNVLASIDSAQWARNEYNGDFISIVWTVLKPSDYAGRKVFQNIKVNDDDDKKAEKAKRMLAAIDANAGGKLVASKEEPTDSSLSKALTGKQMVLKVQKWEMEGTDGETRTGNWVSAVSPKKKVEEVEETNDIGF